VQPLPLLHVLQVHLVSLPTGLTVVSLTQLQTAVAAAGRHTSFIIVEVDLGGRWMPLGMRREPRCHGDRMQETIFSRSLHVYVLGRVSESTNSMMECTRMLAAQGMERKKPELTRMHGDFQLLGKPAVFVCCTTKPKACVRAVAASRAV
jgi:hypothetical protein